MLAVVGAGHARPAAYRKMLLVGMLRAAHVRPLPGGSLTRGYTRISTPFSRKYRFKSLISTCLVWKIDAARPASTAG